MAKPRLRLPMRLAAVSFSLAVAGCPSSSNGGDGGSGALCPPEYYCTTDAARAFNCTDGAPVEDGAFGYVTDLGACYPPV